MKELFNQTKSQPLFFGLIMISIALMAMGFSFGVTFLLLTLVTIFAIYLNKGLHKLDLIYIGLAYLMLLGYLFPKLVNLGS